MPSPSVPGQAAFADAAARCGVRLLFVHGSYATDRVTPRSDLDLAAWFGEARRALAEEAGLLEAMTRAAPPDTPPLDLAILDLADPLLQFMVSSEGRTIYAADPEAYVEFRVRASAAYHDSAPRRRRLREQLRAYARAVRAGAEEPRL